MIAKTTIVTLIALSVLGTIVSAESEAAPKPMSDNMTGRDLENAAKFATDPNFKAPDQEQALRAIYALGFIQGALMTDAHREAGAELDKGDFIIGEKWDAKVYNLILERMKGNETMREANGSQLLYFMLLSEFGATDEMKLKGKNMMLSFTLREGRRVLDEHEKKKADNQ